MSNDRRKSLNFFKNTKEPVIFLFLKFWKFGKKEHFWILFYMFLIVIANIIVLLSPIVFGMLMGEIQNHGLTSQNIWKVIGIVALFPLVDFGFWCFHGPARVIERMAAFRIGAHYREFLLKGLLDLELSWHNKHDSGHTIDKIRKACEGLQSFGENVFQVIQIIVKILGTSFVIFLFSPIVSVFVFFLVVLALYIVVCFDRKLLPQYAALSSLANKAAGSFYDALSNITSVKILHIEKPVLSGVVSRFLEPYPLFCKNVCLNEWKWFTGMMLFQGIQAIPLGCYLFYKVNANEVIDAQKVSTLYLYLSNLMFVFFGFASYYEQIANFRNGVLNAKDIEDVILNHKFVDRKLLGPWNRIAFEKLSFAYEKQPDYPILKDFSISFKKGEKIAIIGGSGSGKTTFFKVLHGMYSNAYAQISLDGNSFSKAHILEIDFKTILIPQDPEVFSSSIRENITLGVPYEESQILKSVELAAFTPVLDLMPHGLDTLVQEKGANLSGGQKQRLALARAILFADDKDLILLDESTSSVDLENETKIYNNIFNYFRDKTVIASIHKMNLLKLFDRIIILKDSKIKDTGTFDDLLDRDEEFKKSWEKFSSSI